MKSIAYKRTENGIEQINNDFNNLNENSPETALMAVYEDLFNKIDKGSMVLMNVRTKEYKESLIDSLQSVMAKTLEDKGYLKAKDMNHFLRKCLLNRFLDNYRMETRYNVFKNDNLDLIIDDKENGITKEFIKTCLIEIKNILNDNDYKIFKLYHIKGFKIQDIVNKLDSSIGNIHRAITRISNKIDHLKISYLYDIRYTSYNSQKKKRQHKRKVMTKKEYRDLCGIGYRVAIDDYQEQKPFNPEPIDSNKIPFNPIQSCYHEVVIDKRIMTQIADTGTLDKDSQFLRNVYTNSYLPIPDKPKYSFKEYRRKKYLRLYLRNIRIGIAKENTRELFKGHKSYLYDDGIQGK